MRITLLILLATVFQLAAQNTLGQNAQLNMPSEKVTVAELFAQIEKQTPYLVVYSNRDIDTGRSVELGTRSGKVSELLTKAFAGTGISYIFENNYIVLTAAGGVSSAAQADTPRVAVTGRVVDAASKPVAGAIVVQQGTTGGTSTDADGRFILRLTPGTQIATVDVSFMGMQSVSRQVSAREPGMGVIVLNEADHALEEVVVVGYGVQKRVNLTGSVATADFDNAVAVSRPLTNASAALSGMLPGVNVQQTTGTPGADNAALHVRGVGTMNSSDPYVLIDGQPGDLNQISPGDIANITVLKDAASSAIYGFRAANGVILITTKTGGNSGGIDIEYNGNVGFSKPTKLFDVISNTADHMQVVNMIAGNSGRGNSFQPDYIDMWRENSVTDPLRYPNTDWWDALIKTNTIQTHQVAARGGNDRMSFYTSVNYQYNDGLMVNSSYRSTNFRNNFDYRVNKWLKVGSNLTALIGDNDAGRLAETFQWFMATTPGMVPKSPDGRYGAAQTGGSEAGSNNLLQLLESNHGTKEKRRYTGKLFAVITPMEGLTINASYFRDMYTYNEQIVTDDTPRWNFQTETKVYTPDVSKGLRGNYNFSKREDYVIDLFATYNKTIYRDHNISLLAGFNQELVTEKGGFSLIKDGLYSVDVPAADAPTHVLSGFNAGGQHAIRSWFGRVNYSYKGRYLFEANLRRDGSSRFAPDERWGTFPSFSAGWRISEEPFWANLRNTIQNLKLRASWGKLGNNSIGNYDWQSLYGSANTSFNGVVVGGLTPGGFPNKAITWETTEVLDFGLDINLFRGMSATFDYYDKYTYGILYRDPIPLVNGGAAPPMVNGPEVRNRGVEGLVAYNFRVADLRVSAGLNGAFNTNRIEKFKNGTLVQASDYGVLLEGYPIGKFYVRQVDHIVQDKAEIDALINQGWTFNPSTPGPGDFLYRNTYLDKRINDDDRVLIGNPIPRFTYGGNLGLEYKGIDLNVIFNGVAGWDKYIQNQFFSLNAHIVGYLYPTDFMNMWTPDNRDTKIPKVYTQNSKNEQISDYHLHSAAYFRIKTLQLGYNLPERWISKVRLKKVRAYVNMENFFTVTDYPGIDPELSDNINYPLMKTVSFGLNLKF